MNSEAKTYRTAFWIMLVSSLIILGCGVYLFFVAGEHLGAVMMGSGATIAAAAAVIGSRAKRKDPSDAG